MSNKDYTKFSNRKPKNKTETVETVTTEPVVEETLETTQEESVVQLKKAVITDCVKLNVRKEPNSKSAVVCEITAKTDMMVDEANSTEDFYKVHTAAGVEGFCMKKFVTLIP